MEIKNTQVVKNATKQEEITRKHVQGICSKYFENSLTIGTYDDVLTDFFPKEEERKQMNMQLSIAISKAIKTQEDNIRNALKDERVKVKMFDSILKILRYRTVINSEYIYFIYFKNTKGDGPSASFNIQYQAEKKILEKNGFINIKEEFVLESELDGLEYISVNGIESITQKKYDFKKRASKSVKELLKDVMFGYATYTRNGERLTLRVEKDTIQKSFDMANSKGEYANFKWNTQQAIKIAITHSLFRFLINQDWDMEFYENEEKPTSKLQTTSVGIQDIEIDDIPENAEKEFKEKRTKEIEESNIKLV